MSKHDETMEGLKRAAIVTGKALAIAGRFVGTKVAGAYHGIDPDLRMHIAQLPLMSYSLFARGDKPLEAGIPDGHPPLVFVHGWGGGRGDFIPMAWYLNRMGRRRSYSIRFAESGDLEARGAELAEFLKEVIAVTGEPQVDIVAHSMGGVATRVAILHHGLKGMVRRVVTLGSPHGGTFAARLGNTAVTHDMRPDSEFLNELARKPLPSTVDMSSFWSSSDLVIMPPESAALEGTNQVDMTPSTHYGYLLEPRCWKAVYRALAGG
jgi:triacylglycerol lipase